MAVKAPKGLVIARSGTTWVFGWKQGEGYSDQQLEYSINGGKWISIPDKQIGKSTTSKAIYNTVATRVVFKVRGKKSRSWSNWTTSSTYSVLVPNLPVGGAELTQPLSTKFSYAVPYSDEDPRQFFSTDWQTKLFPNWDWTAPISDSSWAGALSGSTGASYETIINENGFSGENYSYTRWFRVRSYGWAGYSDWVYWSHVYAVPNKATNITAKYSKLSNKDGYSVSVEWDSSTSYAHPIDSVTVQYLVSAPETTVTIEDDTAVMTLSCPNTDQGWQSLTDVSGIGGKRAMTFTVPTELKDDECIFVRVNNKHDDIITYSDPVLVTDGIGRIATPSIVSIVPGGVSNLYTITVDRKTAIANAFIAVFLRTDNDTNPTSPIGIIPANGTSTSCIIPRNIEGEISFGVKAYIANYTPVSPTSETEPTNYTISDLKDIGKRMDSITNWDGGAVPLPPSSISVIKINDTTAQISWEWSWRSANSAEITWADHEDAWESTDEPSKYVVDNTNASRWNIAGLSVGTWYFRIRLMKVDGESVTYGTYSEIYVLKMSSSPDTPSLSLSDGIISKTGEVTCYWSYVSTDGTPQMYAEVCEVLYEYIAVVNPTGNPFSNGYYELVDGKYVQSFDTEVVTGKIYYTPSGNISYGDVLRSTRTAQHVTLSAEEFGWDSNETHSLAVRVVAGSNESSEGWSAPVSVTIADDIVATIVNTSLVDETETITDDDGSVTIAYKALKTLPMTARATGAGLNGTTTYIIERAAPYHMERPDGTSYDGFEGETIFIANQNGEAPITISRDSPYLIGHLDDGAKYRLIAMVRDPYGQTKEDSIEFKVYWTHQATYPEAVIEADTEHHITKITPISPSLDNYEDGDSVDIYRLSADPPELIYEGADFGVTYVDPYPVIGEFGGHRIVYRTFNGDYITEDNIIAWADYEAGDNPLYKHDMFGIIIDFNGEQLILPYNVSLSNNWTKDFTKTKYLGGSIQGDWNPAVERESSANTTIPIIVEPDKMASIRRLAVYPGICHVRTPDGSSYTANIDVRDDREEKWVPRLSKVSLTIKKVDGEGFDGMTLEAWEAEQ